MLERKHVERSRCFVALAARLLVLALTPGVGLAAQAPAAVDIEKLERAIAALEYEASENARGLQAPNRAHGLRTYFEPGGIRVEDRTAPGSPELLTLRLAAFGRGADAKPLEPGAMVADGARVEIRRLHFVEWYVNSPEGLEHGFTLAKRPPGDAPLRFDLNLHGARPEQRGVPRSERIELVSAGGRRLSYGKLVAFDAHGTHLPSRLELVDDSRLRITVDDAGAVYPLVIDPLLTQVADTTITVSQSTTQLGDCVASAGDVNGDGYEDVIVGASFYDGGSSDEGAAWIFNGSATGIADDTIGIGDPRIESNETNGRLGAAVAGIGDVNGDGYDDIAVGSRRLGLSDQGRVLVFHGGPSGITSGDPTTADADIVGVQSQEWFGEELDGAGDVNGDGYADLIAGAAQWDGGESNEGAAFVFHGGPSGITSGNTTTAPDARIEANSIDARLGDGVAGAGDVNGDGYDDIVVGGSTLLSSAYVFHGGPSGVGNGNPGTADASLTSSLDGLGNTLGGAGDVNGDGYADIVVGARYYDGPENDEGAALIFHGSASGIASGDGFTVADTVIESDDSSAQLGAGVNGAGDVNGDGYADVVIGAPNYGPSTGGTAIYFGRGSGIASGVVTDADVLLSGSTGFGRSVSAGDVNGDGYADPIIGGIEEMLIYHGGAVGIESAGAADASATYSVAEDADFGVGLAGIGDVNGDGIDDFAIGAPDADSGESDEGIVRVYHGAADGSFALAATLESNQADADFGRRIAGAGDVNGDGYADLVVAAPLYNSLDGAVFVFHGSASGIGNRNPSTADTELTAFVGPRLGESVAGAGDVNGDGYADIIVGDPFYDTPVSNGGGAWVFLGGPSGIPSGDESVAVVELQSDQSLAGLGRSVAGAGDVNGDGYDDVIVGASGYGIDEGAAFVFLGSSNGIVGTNPSTAHAQLDGDLTSAQLGRSVASAGDVNADGYADVIVGAPSYDDGMSGRGIAVIFHGSASGITDGTPSTANTVLSEASQNSSLGGSVASAGDVNGDGYTDVIVGATLSFYPENGEGAVFLFLGGSSGVATTDTTAAAARLESNEASAQFGWTVAGLGDVNGDGFADVAGTAIDADGLAVDSGVTWVFTSGAGRPAAVSLKAGSGSGDSLQTGGTSDATDSVGVSIPQLDPSGRARVKAQVEVCLAEVAFGSGGPDCTISTEAGWTDTASASPLEPIISGLTPDTRYRLRARVLRAPYRVTESGITAPANPAHGPWRVPGAGARAPVFRTMSLPDTDSDGIPDAYETNTGVWVSPTDRGTDPNDNDSDDDGYLDGVETNTGVWVSSMDTGTDPNEADSDSDGLEDGVETNTGTFVDENDTGTDPNEADSDFDGTNDGEEVAAGTSPVGADTDADGVCDGSGTGSGGDTCLAGPDNCPFIANAGQTNSDAFAAGDICQCGNVDGVGGIDATDLQRAQEYVVGATPSGPFDVDFCDMDGDSSCGVGDLFLLARAVNGSSVTFLDECTGYGAP